MSVRVEFRWSEDLLGRLDRARKTRLGEISRSAFVRDAVEFKIMQAEAVWDLAEDPTGEHAPRAVERALGDTGAHPSSRQPPAPAEQPEIQGLRHFAASKPTIAEQRDAYDLERRRASPPKPSPPRVPFRRDVKPFQRDDK